jgi:hypothetical protein
MTRCLAESFTYELFTDLGEIVVVVDDPSKILVRHATNHVSDGLLGETHNETGDQTLKLCSAPYKTGDPCKNPVNGGGNFCSVKCRNRVYDQRRTDRERLILTSPIGSFQDERDALWGTLEDAMLFVSEGRNGTRLFRDEVPLAELRRLATEFKVFSEKYIGELAVKLADRFKLRPPQESK